MRCPLCFVLVPFGKKPSPAGGWIDFDALYRDLVAPAITEAGLEPVRAHEESQSDLPDKPTLEGLVFCEYAVVDVTAASPSVFYELGIRQAARPWKSVLLFAEGSRPSFDLGASQAIEYPLTATGAPAEVATLRTRLVQRLVEARQQPKAISLIYQLVEDFPQVGHTKTDVFREQVHYSTQKKAKLAQARAQGVEALRILEKEFGPITDLEAGVVIDLMLSYRAVKAWREMIALVPRMPKPLSETVMVQEQLALALNRAGQSQEGEQVIKAVLERSGPSSESYAILGRIHKDQWEAALKKGDSAAAKSLLDKAIDAYKKGFEADWRDAYPGINAVTLMELREPPDLAGRGLIPVVTYAVERRIATGKPDYWDHATLVELAVLARTEQPARSALAAALQAVRETWEPETTARNLRLIRETRAQRQEEIPWAKEIEDELQKRVLLQTAH